MEDEVMIEMTVDQSRSLADVPESPPRVVDPQTKTTYVLIREDLFERLKSLLADNEEQQIVNGWYEETMGLFGRDGWDDPSMDIYNDLDPRRSS